jgi:hypothetical protein
MKQNKTLIAGAEQVEVKLGSGPALPTIFFLISKDLN